MSSPNQQSPPSQPLGIARSPRRDEILRAASGTPDADASAQAALAAYLNPGGISPPPNIPPRVGSFTSVNRQGLSSSPAPGPGSFTASGSAGGGGFPASISGASSPSPYLQPNELGSNLDTPARGRTPVPMDIETLPDEEKARVLRRHLVSREVRGDSSTPRGSTNAEIQPGGRPNLGPNVHFPSDESALLEESEAPTPRAADDDSEFPIPYATPGGDITYVQFFLAKYLEA